MAEPTRAATGETVLGISVVGDQIVSVVRDAEGQVVASNLVDLPDPSAEQIEAAIDELVASVPVGIDHIGIAVADDAVRNHLVGAFADGPDSPAWHAIAQVSDYPTALVEVARSQATRDGVVAVVELDRTGAPTGSAVTVQVGTGELLGTADFVPGEGEAVTEADGAAALADEVGAMPGGTAITSVICTGPGAEIPGVAPAFEYAVQRPVSIADQPALASALGAADVAPPVAAPATMLTRVTSSSGKRWWFIGAAIGAAIALGAIAITAVLAAERQVTESTPVTTTVTPPTITTTVTGGEVTHTVTENATVTRTAIPPRQTRTSTTTVTAPPSTTTVTETETETETVTENPYNPNSGDGEDGG